MRSELKREPTKDSGGYAAEARCTRAPERARLTALALLPPPLDADSGAEVKSLTAINLDCDIFSIYFSLLLYPADNILSSTLPVHQLEHPQS